MKFSIFNLARFAAIFATTPAALATTWYVNGVTGSDSNNCMSSTTACETIGHAIGLAVSGDSIIVAAATYTESLTIGKSLTILGSGAMTTIIDGGGVGTVVGISSFSAHVTFTGVTIRHGAACCHEPGGGVENLGVLTLTRSIVSGNTASVGAGLWNNGGTMTINNSIVSGNVATCKKFCFIGGGGIFNQGVLTINNSTISGNTTNESGGGIFSNAHTVTISKSTVSGNMAAGGGGIGSINNATVTISNSTVSGNTGGGLEGSFTMTLSNSTVSNNTGSGIDVVGRGSKATLQNSIVANNSGSNCSLLSGTIISNGYNLSSDGSCPFTRTGDLIHTNPLLGPLQNNGGPTQTQALLSGSPAIDTGDPRGCTDGHGHLLRTDQRGMPRPNPEDGGGCDMGAYEWQGD